MITILSGGTGTPKLIEGLRHLVRDEELTVIVNTADDIWWNGLYVSPDVDTVLYLFANILDTEKYWGIRGDTFYALKQLTRYDAEWTWFSIGDKDLATHIIRTYLLKKGLKLHEIVKYLSRKLGVKATILPMSNDRVETIVETDIGVMNIQEYLVKYRAEPEVYNVKFPGLERALPAPGVIDSIRNAEIIIIGPSNPINSIGPIINLKEVRETLRKTEVPIVAVSPIISGKPVSGPADKFMKALGYDPSPIGIVEIYKDFLDGIIIDVADKVYVEKIERKYGIKAKATNTIMLTLKDKVKLAEEVLDLAKSLK